MSYSNVFDWRDQTGEVRESTDKNALFNPNRNNNTPTPPAGLSDILTTTASIKTPAHINRPRSKS